VAGKDPSLSWSNMRAGISAQPVFLRDGAAHDVWKEVRRLPLAVPSRAYLVGCGDSYYAGLAACNAFERWTGIPTTALEALEFSRYAVETTGPDALLIAVSNSGRVARTVECALLAARRRIASLAITRDPESPLARAASWVLPLEYPELGFAPGTLSYLASLVTLLVLALHLGSRTSQLSETQATDWLHAITGMGDLEEVTLQLCSAPAQELATAIDPSALLSILGAGPNLGTAYFAMAKFIESSGINAVGQELEEWAHEQFFCTGPGSHTFVIAPRGKSVDRARELLQAVRDVGGDTIVLCEADDRATAALADTVLPLASLDNELLSPLLTVLPLELIALSIAERLGRTMLGFDDDNRKRVNFRGIFDSAIAGQPGTRTRHRQSPVKATRKSD
jgi:glutamine---fructose-6-phosphate transaminase (isomerizing)